MSAALSKLHTLFDLDIERRIAIVAGFDAGPALLATEFVIGDEFDEVEQNGRIWPAVAFVEALAAGTAVLDTSTIWRGLRAGEKLTLSVPVINSQTNEEPAEAEAKTPTLSELVARSYTVAPTLRPPGPRAASPQAAARFSETPRLALPDIPLDQIMAAPEETPRERAMREWDQFQVWHRHNSGEPGNALGSPAATPSMRIMTRLGAKNHG